MTSYQELKLGRLTSSFSKIMYGIGCHRAVIGLSGGIDSAVAADIAVRALGCDNVSVFCLPHRDSSPSSLEDATATAESLGLELSVIDITPAVDGFCSMISGLDSLRKGNLMARVRMSVLFDMSRHVGGVVVGTTNKTEYLLGYGTWYGDMASSVNMLGTLYKREVYELASIMPLPTNVISKAPSADLWEGQTDEAELGFSYDTADKFFYSVLELGMAPEDTCAVFGHETVSRISSRVANCSFKRALPLVCGEERADEYYKNIFKKYI